MKHSIGNVLDYLIPEGLSRGHNAEAHFRNALEANKSTYNGLYRSRRASILYFASLGRMNPRTGSLKAINEAYERGEGPSFEAIAKPFGGKEEWWQTIHDLRAVRDRWPSSMVPDAARLKEMNGHPFNLLLHDILQRHRDTELASAESPGSDSYLDSVTFSFGDGTDYLIAADIWTGSVYLTIQSSDQTTSTYSLVHELGYPEVYESGKAYLTAEGEAAIVEKVQAFHEHLQQAGQLLPRWRDNVSLLPEKPPFEMAA